MKILICGDSYAADWTKKYNKLGWPNLLSQDHTVHNIAQAGCGEYKILKQLTSVNLKDYDKIIIWHTSPYRIYVDQHPLHHTDPLHKDCDFIYHDIKNSGDKKMSSIIEYFEKYFSTEYANFVHSLIIDHIQKIIEPVNDRVIQIPQTINFDFQIKNNKGLINHFNDEGNEQVYCRLSGFLKNVKLR